jgi:hypothetical protein
MSCSSIFFGLSQILLFSFDIVLVFIINEYSKVLCLSELSNDSNDVIQPPHSTFITLSYAAHLTSRDYLIFHFSLLIWSYLSYSNVAVKSHSHLNFLFSEALSFSTNSTNASSHRMLLI